jgi:CRISPR-associated protein Csd1
MILTALMELATREQLTDNPDYQPMAVRWLIEIGKDGKFLRARDTLQKPETGKGKAMSATFQIPKRSKRTVAVSAEFVIDKASYVFGWVHPDKLKGVSEEKRDQLIQRAAEGHRIYLRELHLATSLVADEALIAWLKFLESDEANQVALPDWTEGDLIAPCYNPDAGGLLTDRGAVVSYWAERRRQPECGKGEAGAVGGPESAREEAQCMVTGTRIAPVRLHPSIKGIPPVSDTKGGVPLTSINAAAFGSYGLEEMGCAAVSQEAADAYQAALNRLLSDGYPHPTEQGGKLPVRNVKLSDNTVVVFWSKHDEMVDLFSDAVNAGNPDAVEALFKSTWKGQPIDLRDLAAFYALTLSGAQGRGTVRGWHESTLGAVLAHVKTYFRQLEIVRPDPGKPMPLLALLRQTSVLGKIDNIAPNLAGEVFQAVLTGQPFPRFVLDALLRRTRSERTLFAERAAFIKACLCRIPHLPEIHPMLDEDCTDAGYRLGRLFAVLEKLQEEAVSANAGIRDRYYGAASATPLVVFPQLLRKAPHHLSKLAGGRRTNLDRLLQSVCEGLQPPTPFPATLALEQQGLFAIGYYHQRQSFFTKKQTAPETATPEEN